MTFEKGDRVAIRSRGLAEIAAYGLGRDGTVQRMMPGGELVVVELDAPHDDPWGARVVPLGRVERIDR